MRGVFINCPDCKSMLLKNAYLRVGTYFNLICHKCGSVVSIRADLGQIIAKVEKKAVVIDDDDGDDTVIFST